MGTIGGTHHVFERFRHAELEDVRRRLSAPGATAREHAAVGSDRHFDAAAAAERHRFRLGPVAKMLECEHLVADGFARGFQTHEGVDRIPIRDDAG